jgi:hypothetical protein
LIEYLLPRDVPRRKYSTQLSSFIESEVLIDEPKIQHCVKSFHCEGTLHCAKQNCSAQDIGASLAKHNAAKLKTAARKTYWCRLAKHNAAKAKNCSAQDIDGDSLLSTMPHSKTAARKTLQRTRHWCQLADNAKHIAAKLGI